MTVIVAARTKHDGIVMACDSEITYGFQKTSHVNPKMWTDGQLVVGSAGDLRAAQVVHHFAVWPELWVEDRDPLRVERFLVRQIWPAIRTASQEHGTLSTSGAESLEASFLLAWDDVLAEFDSAGSVSLPPSGRAAIGTGYAEALGHLGDRGPWTRKQVIEAARKARISAVGVGGPIHVVSTATLDITVEE